MAGGPTRRSARWSRRASRLTPATPPAALPNATIPFESLIGADVVERPAAVNPDAPVVAAFTSGTTSDPKGVLHTHRTLGAEMLQHTAKGLMQGGPPTLTGAPIGHF